MTLPSRRRTFEILERVNGNDRVAKWVNGFIMILVLVNICAVIIESVESIYQAYSTAFHLLEYFSVTVFGVEYLLRLWAYAENEKVKPACLFFIPLVNIASRFLSQVYGACPMSPVYTHMTDLSASLHKTLG